jgi:hypothetical protein
MRTKVKLRIALLLVVSVSTISLRAGAQDLEPRRWTPLPPGTNVVGGGVAVTQGDVLFDPALQVEDAEVEAETLGISYVHAFRLGSKLARFDITVPWQHARYTGLLQGEPATTARSGLMDPTFRLSMILAGAKPDPGAKSNTVVGAALAVIAPMGEYMEDRLINLGQNRWVFRPQVGFVHTRGRWSYELTASAFFFTDNDEFYGDSTREQDPLFAVQGHLIYAMSKPGYWLSLSAGYGGNGQSIIDGNRSDDDQRQFLSALSYGMPLGRKQGLKFAYVRSRTNTSKGSVTDTLAIAWSLLF